MCLEALHAHHETVAHHLYFLVHDTQVGILGTDEAKDETVDGFGHIEGLLVLDEQRLQLVVVKGFRPKLNVLVTDVGQHGRLRVHVLVDASLRHNAPLDVAEKTKQRVKMVGLGFGSTGERK